MTTRSFELLFLESAESQIKEIQSSRSRQGLIKQVKKALRNLSENPNHPGLNSHPMRNLDTAYGVKVFSSYIQNNTPQAHRVLWCYGPESGQITILAVIPHY